MSKERLSKLQKWILVNCYHMTGAQDITKLLPLSGRTAQNDRYVFFRDDILLSYFKLKSSRRYAFLKVHHFKESKAYYSAQASVSRTLKNLYAQNYIWDCRANHVELTSRGKEKAKELLNAKGCNSGEQPITVSNNKDLSNVTNKNLIIF